MENCEIFIKIVKKMTIVNITYETNLEGVLKLQKRVALIIPRLKFRDSVSSKFRYFEMLYIYIYSLVVYKSIIFAHKNLNNKHPVILRDLLQLGEPTETRNKDAFKVPFTRHIL